MARDRFPKRPPRLKELFPGVQPFHFVTFNTLERRSILAQPDIHDEFVVFCGRAKDHQIGVGRYVVMPDHVHLFVTTSLNGMLLEDWIRALRKVLGNQISKLGHARPYWQEGFHDRVLRREESYDQKWTYVRHNPVRAGLCAEPDDWPYQGEIMRLEHEGGRG